MKRRDVTEYLSSDTVTNSFVAGMGKTIQ